MANQYTLDNDFSAIAEPQGTLYNVGDSAIELADSDTTPKGQGILLMTGERRTFSGTLYARSMDTAGLLNVSDFTEAAGGGDDVADVRRPSTEYAVGALVDGAGLASGLVLRCITAGTTSFAALDCSGYELGDTVTDGTVTWLVTKYVTLDEAGGISPRVSGTVDLGSASKAWRKLYAQSIDSPRFRSTSTAYAVGDFCFLSIVEPVKLVCVKAGTTGTGALTLSSTDEGAIQTDGTVVWIVDSLADGIYTAEHQNGIARGGADLTAYWDSGHMSTNIQAGNFVGMHIGDYITKTFSTAAKTYTNKAGTSVTRAAATYTNQKWLLAGFDSYLHSGGNYETADHHVVMITENVPGVNTSMNPTNDTTGGFTGSDMWTQILPLFTTGVQNAFGSAHVLKHEELLSKSISATAAAPGGGGLVGTANNWEWLDVYVNIPNEPMVYGGSVFGGGYDVGTWPRQLPLFALKGTHVFSSTRQWFWLRAVASASYFAIASSTGDANYFSASHSASNGGVRPYFLLH